MTSRVKIFKINEVNFDNIQYTNISNQNGVNVVNVSIINNKKKLPLLVQIDDLYMPDDILQSKVNGKTIYELVLPIAGRTMEDTKSIKTFFENLDNKILNDAKQYRTLWGFSDNQKYKSILRKVEFDENDNENVEENIFYKNGLLKFKLLENSNYAPSIYDTNRTKIITNDYVNKVTGGNYVKSIIEIVAIWSKNNIFGLYIRPHQFKITNGLPPLFELPEYSFNDGNNGCDNVNMISDTEVMETNNVKEIGGCYESELKHNISISEDSGVSADKQSDDYDEDDLFSD